MKNNQRNIVVLTLLAASFLHGCSKQNSSDVVTNEQQCLDSYEFGTRGCELKESVLEKIKANYDATLKTYPHIVEENESRLSWRRDTEKGKFFFIQLGEDVSGCRADEFKGVDGYCWPKVNVTTICQHTHELLRYGVNEDKTVRLACVGESILYQNEREVRGQKGNKSSCGRESFNYHLVGKVKRVDYSLIPEYHCIFNLDSVEGDLSAEE